MGRKHAKTLAMPILEETMMPFVIAKIERMRREGTGGWFYKPDSDHEVAVFQDLETEEHLVTVHLDKRVFELDMDFEAVLSA